MVATGTSTMTATPRVIRTARCVSTIRPMTSMSPTTETLVPLLTLAVYACGRRGRGTTSGPRTGNPSAPARPQPDGGLSPTCRCAPVAFGRRVPRPVSVEQVTSRGLSLRPGGHGGQTNSSSQILTAPNTRSVDQGGTLREFPEATVARPNAQGGLPVLDRSVGARVARRDSLRADSRIR